jgi:hypothetical protein
MVLPRIETQVTPVSVEIAEYKFRRADTGELGSDVWNYMSFHLTKGSVKATLCLSVMVKRVQYSIDHPFIQYYVYDGHHRIRQSALPDDIEQHYLAADVTRAIRNRGFSDFNVSRIAASIEDASIDTTETCYSNKIAPTQFRMLNPGEFAAVTECIAGLAPREPDSAE